MPNNKRFVIMGVSGTGKTTIGKLLSKALDIPFFDGDDYHPQANINKMASGVPLNDHDRRDWLIDLNDLLKSKEDTGAIVACSALKESYRILLSNDLEDDLVFIYLNGSFEEVKSRMSKRKGHFMPLDLLKSQFDTLEVPEGVINVSIMKTPSTIVEEVLKQL